MAGILIIGAVVAFLPFIVALNGRGGVWKFLTLLCCFLALLGSLSIVGGIAAWILAWVFAAIGLSAASTERRMAQMERTARAAIASRPFVPDGVYAGVPYRVLKSGVIEAVMQGSVIRFANMERLSDATAAGFSPTSSNILPDDPEDDERPRWRLDRNIACLIVLAFVAMAIFLATR